MNYTTPYVPPTLTLDAIFFQVTNAQLEVLLIQRQNEPFKGVHALPGVYVAQGQTTTDGLAVAAKRKAGVVMSDISHTEQLYTFDITSRDPRGHAVSVSYMCCGHDIPIDEKSEQAAFYPVCELPTLAFDHADIIRYAHERLRNKLAYTNIAYSLLPKYFTLSQLQTVYESAYGHSIDKRNFRKKILATSMLTETDKTWQDGAHRPAKMYTFTSKKLTETYTIE